MSDTAIFITLSIEELSNSGQLPGDLRSLRNLTNNDERIVHLEVLSDAPLPEKTANALHAAGALLTVLPAASDSSSALVGGLMARLHEFICAYSHVSQFILAGSDSDRLATPAAFMQRAGYYVIVAGPDRGRLDSLRLVADDLSVWSGRQNSRNSGRDNDRGEEEGSKLDPYEVLVDEVTKGREKGQRVLLTSLKQRMRRRMRRFDETRMKDQEGRPMRKFKDFIEDAAKRDLIQLIEEGNRSHVLLPGEDATEEKEEDSKSGKDSGNRKNKSTNRRKDDNTDADPLLDTVDMVEEGSESSSEEEDIKQLTENDFDVEKVNEDADAPAKEFVELLEKLIPESGLTLSELITALTEKKDKEEITASNKEIKCNLQNSFYNELLETVNDDSPSKYVVVDDWKGIIDFL